MEKIKFTFEDTKEEVDFVIKELETLLVILRRFVRK